MKKPLIEPGLLRIYRLFIALRLALLILAWIGQRLPATPNVRRYPLLGIIVAALTLGYLSWPWLQRALGRAYLPAALIVSAVSPIVEHALTVLLRWRTGVTGPLLTVESWQVILALFIPLILISWQYPLWTVVLFCGSTAAIETTLMLPLFFVSRPQFATVLGLIVVRSLLYLLAGYVVVNLMQEQRRQREALAQANAQLARHAATLEQLTLSRERNRISRELHDILAHTLSGAAVQLEAARVSWDDDLPHAQSKVNQALEAIRRGLSETRRAIHALRATPLEDLGLALALRALAETTAERAGLELRWQGTDMPEELSTETEQGIYRIAEQAFTNVVQHAAARTLEVSLMQKGARLTLTIADDGQGFDPDAVSDAHYGLRGMRERAALLGATLEINSRPGQGTRIRLRLEEAV